MRKKNKKKGFTLIELLVVVAIIAILLFLSIRNYKDTVTGSKIKMFESNSRILMWEVNSCYIDENGKVDNIFNRVNPKAVELNGKPEFATYKIDDATKTLICKLDKKAFYGSEDYIITYEPITQKITQEPYGVNGENLIKNATKLTN